MNSKIIAVDFDGTLCENKWPEIGEPNLELIEYLKKRRAAGDKLILWTCRVDERLYEAVSWCANWGLEFDIVNRNLPETLEWMGGDSRKIFAHEYIDDRNVPISACKEKSNMQSWAEKEVEIAYEREREENDEWDYACACYENALKAYNSLTEAGQSRYSFSVTKHILNRLIDGKPLTPIEDTDDVWSDISDISGLHGEVVNYQCKRMSSLFKYVYSDGTVKYRDVNRYYGVNINNPNSTYNGWLIDKVMDEMFPITMPYFPESEPLRVYCEFFHVDRKNGDYDTVGIRYAIKPDGERIEINRFFKENNGDLVEIASCEFKVRRKMYLSRSFGKPEKGAEKWNGVNLSED